MCRPPTSPPSSSACPFSPRSAVGCSPDGSRPPSPAARWTDRSRAPRRPASTASGGRRSEHFELAAAGLQDLGGGVEVEALVVEVFELGAQAHLGVVVPFGPHLVRIETSGPSAASTPLS